MRSGDLRNPFAAPSLCAGGWLLVTTLLVGCGPKTESIKIDGSSTVYPISEAVAEEFLRGPRPDVRVTVGYSGTGGGMKKFTAGEIDICDASRAIKPIETEALAAAEVGFVELVPAFDGIAVVVNPQNDWVECLTVEQLARIWRPDDPANKWSDIDPEWPDERIQLYGPGTDSGTFEYFTKAIVGEAKSCRSDFSASEDDNVLVTGISNDKHALGYFGFAYYDENRDKLKLLGDPRTATVSRVAPDGGNDPQQHVPPAVATVVSSTSATTLLEPGPTGAEFVRYYLDQRGHARVRGRLRRRCPTKSARTHERTQSLPK